MNSVTGVTVTSVTFFMGNTSEDQFTFVLLLTAFTNCQMYAECNNLVSSINYS